MKIFTKLEKRNSIDIVFFVMITRKNICLIYMSKNIFKKQVDLLLKKKKKKFTVCVKDFYSL